MIDKVEKSKHSLSDLHDPRKLTAANFVIKYCGVVVMIVLVPFMLNDFYHDRHVLAIADLIAISLIGIDFAWSKLYNRILIPRAIVLSCFCTILWYAISQQGAIGIYWSYPFISIMFFVLPHRSALVLIIVFLTGVAPLSYVAVGETETYRVMLTLSLNGLVAYVFSYIVDTQKNFLSEQAITDELTGAYNRRHLDSRLQNLIKESTRHNRKLSKILFDIDHFKKINDENGHEFGDRVLCAITDKVRARVRVTDQIFRQGGDEFVVLLPDTGKSEALKIADDIRQLIDVPDFARTGSITISCGVSEYSAGESSVDWANRTDKTMYLAKQQGRNRVISEDEITA